MGKPHSTFRRYWTPYTTFALASKPLPESKLKREKCKGLEPPTPLVCRLFRISKRTSCHDSGGYDMFITP